MPEQAVRNSGGEIAYSVLRKNIVELRLKPGAVLSIKELCATFGLNRTPARDALIRLEQEGLVSLLPQRGVMIAKIDLSRVENERFLRASAERGIMRAYLAKKRGPDDEAALVKIIALQEDCLAKKEYRRNMALDDAFHRYFYDGVGLSYCADIIWRASGQYSRLRLLIDMDAEASARVLGQHGAMAEALRCGDEKGLFSVLESHLSKIEKEGRELRAAYPDLFVTEVEQSVSRPELEDFLASLGAQG